MSNYKLVIKKVNFSVYNERTFSVMVKSISWRLEYMRKTKRLTARQSQFITIYKEKCGNMAQVAEAMGVSVSRAYQIKEVELVKNELEGIVEETRQRIKEGSARYLETLHSIMEAEGTPPSVKVNIAQDLLDRAGVVAPKTPAVQVNINTFIADNARKIMAERLAEDAIDVEAEPVRV